MNSGTTESITITNEKGRLSQEDIDRVVKEAEEFVVHCSGVLLGIPAANNVYIEV